jgi:uncharacterized protein involved in response to NO
MTHEGTGVDPRMTVAEILKRWPEARPVLAGYGLDACCGGSHPLEFACRAHKVSLDEVVKAIAAVAATGPGGATGGGARAAGTPGGTSGGGALIDPAMSVRDVIAAHPATLPVFARHGLMGCGGARGPEEPIGWFAEVHHVDLPGLLRELDDAARAGAAAPTPAEPEITPAMVARENLYRRFLKAALLFTLTGGTALGAWALVLMGMRGELGGIGRGLLQVHGLWQLFGWVGLFVVGVAYHILPRLTGVPLPSYRLASWSFVMLFLGTVLRAAQALGAGDLRSALLIGGAVLEAGGCAVFGWSLARILASRFDRIDPYQFYLALGTGWLGIAVLLNLAHAGYLAATGAAVVPAWLNLPYLTVFLLGFVGFWILGVSLRTLPVFMGLRSRPQAAVLVSVPLTMSLLLLSVGEASYLAGGDGAARLSFGAGGAATAVFLGIFIWALGILGRPTGEREPGVDRGYEKFLRVGYAWLGISAAMLFVFSLLVLAGRDMDHALVGAYRHALTVGFITTVMVGMASRIVPVFRGVPLHSPLLREWTFRLLVTGNVVRVLFQSLSAGGNPAWLRVASLSGILEMAALVLFAWNLWRTMNAPTPEETAAAGWKPPIASDTRVGELLAAYPGLLPVFVSSGFAPLANPILRRTLARGISVAQACRMHGVDLQSFLGRLQEAQTGRRS